MYGGCHSSSRPRASSASRDVHRLDEPLAAGDDLERTIALLVELDGVRDRPRLAEQVAALAQQLDDARARLDGRQPGELVVVPAARARGSVALPARLAPRDRLERAVRLDDRAHRQAELAPPDHVGDVAERADHRDAGALFGIGERMRPHRHAHAEERRHDLGAEERLIARDRRDARRARRTPESARAASCRSRRSPSPSGAARTGCGGRRPAARDPRARPARRPCGSRRPTASALRADTPARARRAAGTPAATAAARDGRSSRRSSTSRPTGRGGATDARTPSRPRPSAARTAR